MRVQAIRLICPTLLIVAALLTQAAPSAAIGGTCSFCRRNYESCMESRYNAQGYVTPDDEEMCGSFAAGCWATCSSTEPQMCTYNYDFFGCGQWVYGASWETNYEASHYCTDEYNDYSLIRTHSSCY